MNSKPYTRRSFATGNARAETIAAWKRDRLKDAIAALVLAGGCLSGPTLGSMLGVSPRGLRPLFAGHAFILAERRGADGMRGETWYRMDFTALPAPQAPPLLGHASG